MSSEEDRREAAERLRALHGREDDGQIRHRQTRSRVASIAHRLGWAIIVWSVLALIAIPLLDSGFDLRTVVSMIFQSVFGAVGYALTKWPD